MHRTGSCQHRAMHLLPPPAAASYCPISPGFSGLEWKPAPAHHGREHWGSPDFGRSQLSLLDCSPVVLFICTIIHLKVFLWDLRSWQFYSMPFLSHLMTTAKHFVCLFVFSGECSNYISQLQQLPVWSSFYGPFCVKLVLIVTAPGLVLCCFE